jgi:hypothetical protein
LVIDYDRNGTAIGVEITAPSAVPLERLNWRSSEKCR